MTMRALQTSLGVVAALALLIGCGLRTGRSEPANGTRAPSESSDHVREADGEADDAARTPDQGAGVDATVDASIADAPIAEAATAEASGLDAHVADASIAYDAFIADASIADAFIADTSVAVRSDGAAGDGASGADAGACSGLVDSQNPRVLCANESEVLVYTDLARSAEESRQTLAVEYLGRNKSRSVFGLGLLLSHCVGGACPYGEKWRPGIRVYGGYDLTARPGFAMYLAPSLYFDVSGKDRGFAIAPQVGLSAHMHPSPSRRFGLGVRAYVEPRVPVGRGGSVDMMFGLGLFVSGGGRFETMTLPPNADTQAPSLAETLQQVVDRELSDVAVGDATVRDCRLFAGASAEKPYEVPGNERCAASLSRAIKPQTCALIASVADVSVNARLLVDGGSGAQGESLLVQDVSASTWPVVTWCNATTHDVAVLFQLWAPSSETVRDALASRFDFAIPWGSTGGREATASAEGVLALQPTACSLVHIRHGGDKLVLTSDATAARRYTVSAPWYMELKLVGATLETPNDVANGFLWTSRPAFELTNAAVSVQPETGGPIMFCPADAKAPHVGLDAGQQQPSSDAGVADAASE